MGQCGRTRRCRNRRKQTTDQPISKAHEVGYVHLLKMAKLYGFHNKCRMQPAEFTDTGRGLMALSTVNKGDLIISIPEALLITTKTALQLPMIKEIVKSCGCLSPIHVLCLFLIHERQLAGNSPWFPYINTLPTQYSTPAYFTNTEIAFLPLDIRWKAEELKSSIFTSFNSLKIVISKSPFHASFLFTYDEYLWAWHVINTRCVYMMQEKSSCLSNEVDHFALAPFLDLLNHSANVEVEASFNTTTRCYEIRSCLKFPRYSQVFICYGPHDNARLLLEYGFILPDNPNNVVTFSLDEITTAVNQRFQLQVFEKKQQKIHENNLKNFNCSSDGCSWDLLKACEIQALDYQHLTIWKPHLEINNFKLKAKEIMQFILETKSTQFQEVHSQLLQLEQLSDHEKMTIRLYEQYLTILNSNISRLHENMQH